MYMIDSLIGILVFTYLPLCFTGPQPGVANPDLSSIEVENILKTQVKKNYTQLLQVL